jgi:hypothetical protein
MILNFSHPLLKICPPVVSPTILNFVPTLLNSVRKEPYQSKNLSPEVDLVTKDIFKKISLRILSRHFKKRNGQDVTLKRLFSYLIEITYKQYLQPEIRDKDGKKIGRHLHARLNQRLITFIGGDSGFLLVTRALSERILTL